MKVAIVTLGTYPLSTGGVQLHSYYHAKHLAEAANDVTVITKPPIEAGRRQKRLTEFRVMIVGSNAPVLGQASFVLRGLGKLFAIRPDVVHVHFATFFAAPAYIFGVLTGTPYIVSCHGFDIITLRQKAAWKAIQKVFFRRAARVTAASSELKAMLLNEYGLPESKVEVVSNGVELSEIDAVRQNETKRVAEATRRIVYLANLRPVKDPLLALDAFRVLRQRRDDVQLVVIGEGELGSEMRRRIGGEKALEESVTMKGELTHHDAMAELATCDVFLLTSKEEGGNPLSLMEAMAMGKPVVSANVGGAKDVMIDRVNGLLVAVRSPESFAEKADALLDDDDLARKIAAGARETAERYSWEKVVDRYVLDYIEATKKRG